MSTTPRWIVRPLSVLLACMLAMPSSLVASTAPGAPERPYGSKAAGAAPVRVEQKPPIQLLGTPDAEAHRLSPPKHPRTDGRWLDGYRPGTAAALAEYGASQIAPKVTPRPDGPTTSQPIANPADFGIGTRSRVTERDAKVRWYRSPANWNAERRADGSLDVLPRDPSLALGASFGVVPEGRELHPDVVHTAVGSFSVQAGKPHGFDGFLGRARAHWSATPGGQSLLPGPLGAVDGSGYYLLKLSPERYTGQELRLQADVMAAYPSLRLVQYVGNATFIAKLDHRQAARLARDGRAAWISPYAPYLRIGAGVGRVPLAPPLAALPVFELVAVLFPGESPDAFAAEVARLYGEVLGIVEIPWPYDPDLDTSEIYFRLHRDRIPELALFEGLKSLDEISPRQPHNDVTPSSNQTGGFGAANNRPYWQAGIDGRTQMGADSGVGGAGPALELDNPSFAKDCTTPATINGTLVCADRKVVRFRGPATTSGGYSHESNTSANMLGNASAYDAVTNPGGIGGTALGCPRNNDGDSDTWPDFDGVARGAKLTHLDLDTAGSVGEYGDMTNVYGDACTLFGNVTGARVHNRSYGYTNSFNVYDDFAAGAIDTFSFSNRDYLAVTSAGNTSTKQIPSPGSSKNDVTVGVSNQWPNLYRFGFAVGGFSNFGPETTASGRMGPTIVNVGANNSTAPASYESASFCANTDANQTTPIDCAVDQANEGTSFSAPFTAGEALLVRDYFQQGFYPAGANTGPPLTVSGALTKAVLIAATDIMTTNQQGQANRAGGIRWGYGVPILSNVLKLAGDSRTPVGMRAWDRQCIAQGGTFTVTLPVVPSTTQPLRVALVWTDGPGDLLVNNLNLRVTAPGGTNYRGNQFTAAYSNTSASFDTLNVTEAVIIDPASVTSGNWTITVTAPTINMADPLCPLGQQFALIATGDIPTAAGSSLTFTSSTFKCSDTLTVDLNDATKVPASYAASQVVLTTSSGDSETIPAGSWVGSSCSGGDCNNWQATIDVIGGSPAPDGDLNVTSGGTITGTYADTHGGHASQSTTASVDCRPRALDAGYVIAGGCDEGTAGERYAAYMDRGELINYTVGVYNNSIADLTDARVTIAKSGTGAGDVTFLGPTTVTIGRIAAGSASGATFSMQIGGAAAIGNPLSLDFGVTSPADGYTTAATFSQVQLLHADDVYAAEGSFCGLHNSADMTALLFGEAVRLPWTRFGSTSCGFENRTDGICDNATAGMYMTASGCGTTPASNNHALNAIEVLMSPTIQPTNRGTAPNGQAWRYGWKFHSFYAATEELGNASAGWEAFYHNNWGSATAPTNGNAVLAFPYASGSFVQSVFDGGINWDWNSGNTGTPDYPFYGGASAPPNQTVVTFDGVTGLSTNSTYFIFGHQGYDLGLPRRDMAVDNDRLAWDEIYADADTAGSCSGACGTVALDKASYAGYLTDTATIVVLDGNAVSPIAATVTSTAGDSETVTLTGTAPRFSGTLTLNHAGGGTPNDGTLYVLPTDTVTATYTDASPSCQDVATATVNAPGGDIVYLSHAVDGADSSGDGDPYADTNETVHLDVTIQNKMVTASQNTMVRISTASPLIDCIQVDTVAYGSVAAGASATNPAGTQFRFHVSPSVACAAWQTPPTATFNVYIWGDGYAGNVKVESFTMALDLDPFDGPAYTYTEAFTTNPNWVFGVGPGDDDGACPNQAYLNDWKYTATNGRTGGGYTAWVGDVPFGTSTYRDLVDSVLYSPVLVAGAASPTLTFDRAYGTEVDWDGAAVQYSINGGAWTYMTFTGMSNLNPDPAACSPLLNNINAWHGGPSTWATTNTVAIPAAVNDTFQFRFRLGSDQASLGAGYGIDNVVITNVKQTVDCDVKANLCLPGGCAMTAAPPGEAGKAGATTALKARKGLGTSIELAFGNACNSIQEVVYWSTQPFPIDAADWTLAGCNITGGCDNATFVPGFDPGATTGLAWFVVVGRHNVYEGSYGKATGGAERPAHPSGCKPQNLVGNCP